MAELVLEYTYTDTGKRITRYVDAPHESWCDILPEIIQHNREYSREEGVFIREASRGFSESGLPFLDTLFGKEGESDMHCRIIFERTPRFRMKVQWLPSLDPETDTVVLEDVFGSWANAVVHAS